MKFISNILLATSLVIYIFFPLFDLGLFGTKTGYDFTETMINSHETMSHALFSLLPFIGCFGGIIFNCLKNRYWSLLSLAFIGIALFFFYSTYTCGIHNCPIFKITGLSWGFETVVWLISIAGITTIMALIPFERLGIFAEKKEN